MTTDTDPLHPPPPQTEPGQPITAFDEALVRRTFGDGDGWPIPALLAEIDRLRAALSSPPTLDIPATFPLNIDAFLAGIDSPSHSPESRRAWITLFFRDMQRAAPTPTFVVPVEALDHRRTCGCGHRYGVHATGGEQCLAVVDDPDATSLRPCYCHGWDPR